MRTKTLFKKEKRLSIGCGLFIAVILLFSSISVPAVNTTTQTPFGFSNPKPLAQGEEKFFEENFTNESIPPYTAPWGPWKNTTTSGQTWFISTEQPDPLGEIWHAEVTRGSYTGSMDERLITPTLDFHKYNTVRLQFRWWTSDYAIHTLKLMDLNVSVTNDNEVTWTQLWSASAQPDFWSWQWQDGNVDLSAYAGQSNIRLRFQFNSWSANNATIQLLSLDTVQFFGDVPTDFTCDCGLNETVSWSWNKINGVKFLGEAKNGTIPYKNWTWDFGDGTGDTVKNTVHSYTLEGTYHITLTVEDSARPPHLATSSKTVKVVESPPPPITITIPTVSLFKIKVNLKNTGQFNLTDVAWEIWIIKNQGLQQFEDKVGYGNISSLDINVPVQIQSDRYFTRGWGLVVVKVAVYPLNSDWAHTEPGAIKIGPFVILQPGVIK
jgi:hypothetical protein